MGTTGPKWRPEKEHDSVLQSFGKFKDSEKPGDPNRVPGDLTFPANHCCCFIKMFLRFFKYLWNNIKHISRTNSSKAVLRCLRRKLNNFSDKISGKKSKDIDTFLDLT